MNAKMFCANNVYELCGKTVAVYNVIKNTGDIKEFETEAEAAEYYSITVNQSEVTYTATLLYLYGWRYADKEELSEQYDTSDDEFDSIMAALQQIERGKRK